MGVGGVTQRIEAVSFDLWDTMIADQTDEPKRKSRGLRTKVDERRHLVHEALARHGEISVDVVAAACRVVDKAARKVWLA